MGRRTNVQSVAGLFSAGIGSVSLAPKSGGPSEVRSRIRQVHPEFFKHEGLAALEFSTGLPIRIAFIGLWCIADCRGLFQWKHRAMKREILPDDNLDFEAVLTALESGGFVQRYTVNNETYGQIPTFGKWQHFHKNEKPHPHIPDPETGQLTRAVQGKHRHMTPASASASASASTNPLKVPLSAADPNSHTPALAAVDPAPGVPPRKHKRRPSASPDSRDTFVDRVIRGEI